MIQRYSRFRTNASRLKRSPLQRVVAQWRGVDLEPLKRANTSSTRPAADLVRGVTDNIRLKQRQGETEIVKVWNNLVDPNVATHAQPTGLRNGTLFVTVDSSVWLDEIVRYRRKEILTLLQHSFGRELIARISFRVG
jgi:predicted nucleic acid-binding Zn ribbon protein